MFFLLDQKRAVSLSLIVANITTQVRDRTGGGGADDEKAMVIVVNDSGTICNFTVRETVDVFMSRIHFDMSVLVCEPHA